MSKLTKFFREREAGKRLNLEERYRELIARLASGKTFVDVGCMWKVNGGYALHAAAHGAARVVGFDINEATPEFEAQNAAGGNKVQFVRGDLISPDFAQCVGPFDIIFCVSVVQYIPDPVRALLQLRRVCARWAIIGIPTVPERDDLPHAAVYLPFLDDDERRALMPTVASVGTSRGSTPSSRETRATRTGSGASRRVARERCSRAPTSRSLRRTSSPATAATSALRVLAGCLWKVQVIRVPPGRLDPHPAGGRVKRTGPVRSADQ